MGGRRGEIRGCERAWEECEVSGRDEVKAGVGDMLLVWESSGNAFEDRVVVGSKSRGRLCACVCVRWCGRGVARLALIGDIFG